MPLDSIHKASCFMHTSQPCSEQSASVTGQPAHCRALSLEQSPAGSSPGDELSTPTILTRMQGGEGSPKAYWDLFSIPPLLGQYSRKQFRFLSSFILLLHTIGEMGHFRAPEQLKKSKRDK